MLLQKIVVSSRTADIQHLARRFGREVYIADDPADCLDIAGTVRPDLVVFEDQWSPARLGDFICALNGRSANIPVVVVSRDTASQKWPDSDYKRAGALDYLHGPVAQELEQIAVRISAGDGETGPDGAEKFFADELAAQASMVGQSSAIRDTLRMIRLVASSKCNPVLIVGETGTGKELAAKAVHTLRHPGEEFVAVNCASLTTNLLESELFGHTKGSFTSADREKTGLLELAGEGTIFLDEISEMPVELQAKLLRVLQEKTFRKVGGIRNIVCKATIIASSNRNLSREVRANRFRRDLYYRLNIFPISIAPLRTAERKGDIRLLADYFLRTSIVCPEKAKDISSITNMAMEVLENHTWPGNARELRNVIERAVLLESTDKIGLSTIVIDSADWSVASHPTLEPVKDFSLEKAERELIALALKETGWQKTRAAALLGITRATLYAKVRQHNIQKAPKTAVRVPQNDPGTALPEPVTAV